MAVAQLQREICGSQDGAFIMNIYILYEVQSHIWFLWAVVRTNMLIHEQLKEV